VDRRYSAQQIADHLGVAEKTVRRWIDRGLLPAERQGHSFAIRLSEAEAVFATSRSGRAAGKGSDAELRAQRAEATVAEFRGRCSELRDQVMRLERELAEERRRSAILEVRLDAQAA
jgi:excisionase family DNA binding protein